MTLLREGAKMYSEYVVSDVCTLVHINNNESETKFHPKKQNKKTYLHI